MSSKGEGEWSGGLLLIISCCLWLHVLPLMTAVAATLLHGWKMANGKWTNGQMETQAAVTTVRPGAIYGFMLLKLMLMRIAETIHAASTGEWPHPSNDHCGHS